jgi:IclR family pca regulon transcriptional regulator
MPAPHRIMSATLAVGSRLPAFHTSLGRIQRGFLGEAELRRRLTGLPLARYTTSTIIEPAALVARIMADHAEGYSIVDEEPERGLRSIAVRSSTAVAELSPR